MFPLSTGGYAGEFQDIMHMVTTGIVVLLSIASLTVIIIAGAKDRRCRSYGVSRRSRAWNDACRRIGYENCTCRILRRC